MVVPRRVITKSSLLLELLLLLLHLGHHLLEARLAAQVREHLRVHLVHHLRHRRRVHVVQVHAALAHLLVLLHRLLHGGLHELELLEQLHHLVRVVAAAAGDAKDARGREHLSLVKLRIVHRVHHRHPLLDAHAALMEVEAGHAGELVHDVAEGAHLEHGLELLPHVPQRPLPRRQALHHLGGLLLEVDVGLLHLLHEAGDVALAEHPTHERLDLEVLEVLDVLPRAHVRDGRAGGRDGR
mmetsp:Transcript_20872/g.49439  ORF Transcript_20872/g.49439 Transcript_20872/m.49439 type:complete len:240 (-) Transcript_20872:864-1583(-)